MFSKFSSYWHKYRNYKKIKHTNREWHSSFLTYDGLPHSLHLQNSSTKKSYHVDLIDALGHSEKLSNEYSSNAIAKFSLELGCYIYAIFLQNIFSNDHKISKTYIDKVREKSNKNAINPLSEFINNIIIYSKYNKPIKLIHSEYLNISIVKQKKLF